MLNASLEPSGKILGAVELLRNNEVLGDGDPPISSSFTQRKTECVLSTESMHMTFFQEKGKQEDRSEIPQQFRHQLSQYTSQTCTQHEMMYLKGNRNERRHRSALKDHTH
ncbi:hypothetical protein E5288_WYG012678 [Bos mutus]|uniref:Uncharacterized protein n=1 Tax=Bos mutus TaxID=72004 RepID=A0A6B0QZR9_9CETA|nr:hypothetical protein [Bos mutus]